ncbi:MAG: aspartyl/glutamyl-tRNA amidotransferase subunit C [Planctomycetes bacterium]|jgi:aspartyl-tRNA(Asn)/glutamyl-tRNA(Gln) amidotransferase subunit C|nr:aspartyl/glutamyl-tRNA amidotransferase subunit C [Planctomycetota bacterium]
MPSPIEFDRTTIQHLAELARLHLPADRLPVLRQRLQRLVDAFGALGELPLPNADQQGGQPGEPQAALVLRPDVPLPPLSPEQALANAPQQAAGAFVVPRVVDA